MPRTMLKTFALALALLCSGGAAAQDLTVGWNPRTGDVWVDTWLGDMNRYGARYRDPFVDELVRYHGAPRDLVLELLVDRRWAPGDVYFACALARLVGRPCRYVVDIWERDRGLGWGAVAKRLGIKPGSPEFHRLKQGFVPTYDRWGRPIVLDAELERAFPGRGKGGAPKAAGGPGKHDGHPGGGKGKGGEKGKDKQGKGKQGGRE